MKNAYAWTAGREPYHKLLLEDVNGREPNLTDELAAKLSAMPHHRQAMIVAFPHGVDARQFAADFVLSLERSGRI